MPIKEFAGQPGARHVARHGRIAFSIYGALPGPPEAQASPSRGDRSIIESNGRTTVQLAPQLAEGAVSDYELLKSPSSASTSQDRESYSENAPVSLPK
jgi:hypothetical protein